jgi:hypothetical protein
MTIFSNEKLWGIENEILNIYRTTNILIPNIYDIFIFNLSFFVKTSKEFKQNIYYIFYHNIDMKLNK